LTQITKKMMFVVYLNNCYTVLVLLLVAAQNRLLVIN